MQFFEFIGGIADSSVHDGAVHLSTGQMQPIAADDVAEIVAEVALSKPLNGTMEIVGDERASLSDIVSNYMKVKNGNHKVVASADASYFGVRLQERSLVPAAQRKPAMMRQRFPLCMTTRCPTFPARA